MNTETFIIVQGRSVVDNKLFKFEIPMNKKFRGTLGEQVFIKLSKYVEKYYSKTMKVFSKDLHKFALNSTVETGKINYKNRKRNEKFYTELIKEVPACSLAFNGDYHIECEKEWGEANSLKSLMKKMNDCPVIVGHRDWLRITKIKYVPGEVIEAERTKRIA